MTIPKFIIKNIVYPAFELFQGTKSQDHYKWLLKTQYKSKESIEKIQLKRLIEVINHAFLTVPYYNKLFRKHKIIPTDIKSLKDMDKIPILTKSDIQNNFEDLISTTIPKNQQLQWSTGGSSGNPLIFMRTKLSLGEVRAAEMRSFHWAGADFFGDKWIYISSSPKEYKIFKNIGVRIYMFLMNRKMLSTFDINENNLKKYINTINNFKPKVVYGYASGLNLVSEYILNNKLKIHKPKTIISCSEKLYPQYRKNTEQAFKTKVYDTYGSHEFMMASEIKKDKYAIHAENVLVESLDKNNKQIFGKQGRFVITDLSNYATPLLRYENGDVGIMEKNWNKEKIHLPIISKVEGRVTDFIQANNGDWIHGEYSTHLFYHTKGIKEFRLIQENKNLINLIIVKSNNFKKDELDKIIIKTKKKLGEKTKVNITFKKKISPLPSGKLCFTQSKIKNPYVGR